jgi:hypothetical protein
MEDFFQFYAIGVNHDGKLPRIGGLFFFSLVSNKWKIPERFRVALMVFATLKDDTIDRKRTEK